MSLSIDLQTPPMVYKPEPLQQGFTIEVQKTDASKSDEFTDENHDQYPSNYSTENSSTDLINRFQTTFDSFDDETKKRLSLQTLPNFNRLSTVSGRSTQSCMELDSDNKPDLSSAFGSVNTLFPNSNFDDIYEIDYGEIISATEPEEWNILFTRSELLNTEVIKLRNIDCMEKCIFIYEIKKSDADGFEKLKQKFLDLQSQHEKFRIRENESEKKTMMKRFTDCDKFWEHEEHSKVKELIKQQNSRIKNSKKYGINPATPEDNQQAINDLIAEIHAKRDRELKSIRNEFSVLRMRSIARSYNNKHNAEFLLYKEFHDLELNQLQEIEMKETQTMKDRWKQELKILQKKQAKDEKVYKKTTSRDVYMKTFREELALVTERHSKEDKLLQERFSDRSDSIMINQMNCINKLKHEFSILTNSCITSNTFEDVLLDNC